MVPFSFENITRSAALDVLNALPVSDAARATHESFESHLQLATTPPPESPNRVSKNDKEPHESTDSPSNDPPRQEPIRQDAGETRHDNNEEARQEEEPNAAPQAAEPTAERDDEDVEQEYATGEEAIVATNADEQRATIQELELDVSEDVGDNVVDETANQLASATLVEDESQLNTPVAVEGDVEGNGEGVEENASGERQVKRIGSQSDEIDDAEVRNRQLDELEANKKAASAEVAETDDTDKPQDVTASQVIGTPQRHRHRADITTNQQIHEAQDESYKPVDITAIDAALDSAKDEGSRHRRDKNDGDNPQPIATRSTPEGAANNAGTPSRFAQHLLAKNADPNARGVSITDADQVRFVDRVARAVQATGERGGTLRLRLSPPELGSLTLEVKVQGGAVSARVEADTPAARSLLLENLPLLRERLAEQGMRVDQFDVDLTDRHASGTPEDLQQNDQQQEDRPRSETSSQEPDDTPPENASDAPTTSGNEQLNIIV